MESVCGVVENAVGFKKFTRQPWITSGTLEIVDQRRAAWLAHDLDEYRALNPLRNAALQRDRQAWADGIADSAEVAIQQGKTHDAFKGIKRLKSGGPSTSAPIKDLDGKMITERSAKLSRWAEYCSTLLNRPPPPPSPELTAAAASASPDLRINCAHPCCQRLLPPSGN